MILINGQPDNRIPVTDRGLQYGDGLFETLVFRQGEIEFLEAHLARLMLGCERLKIPFTDIDKLKVELVTLCTQLAEDSVVKIIVSRGSGGRGYKAPANAEPLRIISSHPMPDYPVSCQQGVVVRLCEQRLGISPSLAGIKHLNRLEQVLARSEWESEAVREGLMLDIHDRLVEGTMSNVFVVKDEELLTPPIIDNGIAGIMRAEVIKLAREMDITVTEKELTLEKLYQADEVFLTNSIIDIWPVLALSEKDKHWSHGTITQALQTALKNTTR